MIGGTSLFVWPSLIGTEKPSQAVPCCCTPSQSGCAMRDKPLSESPACTPARFPPPRRFGPSAKFLRGLVETAEQLAPLHRWREILSRAFQAFLKGRPLRAPLRLKPG